MAKKKKMPHAESKTAVGIQQAEAAQNGNAELILPEEFTARMRRLLKEEEYGEFIAAYENKRHFSLRINPLKVSREQFLELPGLRGNSKNAAQTAVAGDAGTESAAGSAGAETAVAGEGLRGNSKNAAQTAAAGSAGTESAAGSAGAETAVAGEGLLPVPWEPEGFYYPEEMRPGRHPRHEAGMYYIQEASAMVPAMLCGAVPGEKVLDLCAAPGGKATKLAGSLRGKGILVANEIHSERAKILSANIERMGVRNALVTNETPQQLASRFPSFFDRIVVDAPCSGEGMFRKEEEALRHWSLENVRMCAERQTEILEEAAVMLRPGGTLVYSTCTFSPEENESVIARFVLSHPDFSVCRISDLPGVDMEGWGFAPGQPAWAQFPDEVPEDGGSNKAPEDGGSNKVPEDGGPDKVPEDGGPEEVPEDGCPEEVPEDGSPDEFLEKREQILKQLEGTIRLWPHRLNGEGHFAAVLRREETGRRNDDSVCDQALTSASGKISAKMSARSDTFPGRGGRDKKEYKKKQKKRGGGKTHVDSGRQEMLKLWREFCEETLRMPSAAFEDQETEATEEVPEKGSVSAFGTESGGGMEAVSGEVSGNKSAGTSGVRSGENSARVGRADLFPEENLMLFGESLYALPFPADTMSFAGMRILRPGLQLGTVVKGRFVPAHALGMALRGEEVRRVFDLEGGSPEAYAWIRGEAIPLSPDSENGWTLVRIDGCAAGWGKTTGTMLKNHYPKGLRKIIPL